jgi:hypothetical protein
MSHRHHLRLVSQADMTEPSRAAIAVLPGLARSRTSVAEGKIKTRRFDAAGSFWNQETEATYDTFLDTAFSTGLYASRATAAYISPSFDASATQVS